jgi:hypothetical protein
MQRLPGESDEAFKARAAAAFPGAGVPINVPQVPNAQPQASPGMLGGMGGAPPMPAPPPMDPGFSPSRGGAEMDLSNSLGMKPPPMAESQFQPVTDPNAFSQSALDALAGVPVEQAELLGLEEQRERANALRDTALPEGRQAGRTFVAANPLEFLGAGIKQYRGGKKSEELQKEIGEKRASIGGLQGEYTKEAAKRGGLDVVKSIFRRKPEKKTSDDDED